MENQNVEYKEAWRDEYLKWICGFANAQGGRLLVGVADDGRAVGVDEPKQLMKEIPVFYNPLQHLSEQWICNY